MRQHHLNHGQLVKAMVLTASGSWNGVSTCIQSSSRISPSTGSWEAGITPDHLNDDILLFLQTYSGNESDEKLCW